MRIKNHFLLTLSDCHSYTPALRGLIRAAEVAKNNNSIFIPNHFPVWELGKLKNLIFRQMIAPALRGPIHAAGVRKTPMPFYSQSFPRLGTWEIKYFIFRQMLKWARTGSHSTPLNVLDRLGVSIGTVCPNRPTVVNQISQSFSLL